MKNLIPAHLRYQLYTIYATATADSAVATRPADVDETWCVERVIVNYAVAPTTPGTLTVVAGSTTLLSVDILTAGYHVFDLDGAHHLTSGEATPEEDDVPVKNEAMVGTLTTGGDGVVGTITMLVR